MENKRIMIIPDCSDFNRGDQALVWETARVIKDAGYEGDFYVQAEFESCEQSRKYGLKCFTALLPHPSRDKRTDNVTYGPLLMIKWGFVAIIDFIKSFYLLLISKYPSMYWTLPSKTRSTLELYKGASAVFVKGGGFLDSYGGLSVAYFIYYHLFSLYLANRLGIPSFFMPNSFGPLDGFTAKWQVKKALSRCKAIYCRESISYNYMKEHFPKIRTINTYDLAFYLPKKEPVSDFQICQTTPKVAITVRPYRFPEYPNGSELYKKYIESFQQFSLHLIDNGFHPVFIQHTLAINLHEDDMVAITDVTRALPQGKFTIFKNVSYNCMEMKSVYSHFDYIIGTRFHSVIFSLASQVPAIAIAYGGNKSRGIMRDLNLEDYVINIGEVNSTSLCNAFDKLVSKREDVINQLKDVKQKQISERLNIISNLQRLFINKQ